MPLTIDGAVKPAQNSEEWGPTYSIREASRVTQIAPHIIRYWESNRLLDPDRTTKGHRRFRQKDIDRIMKVKELFYVKGLRVEGAKKALTEEARRKRSSDELPLELTAQSEAYAVLTEVKDTLKEILRALK